MNEPSLNRIPRNCAVRLQAVYTGLRKAERRAADFLLAHPEEIHDLPIVSFADRAGCSEATIVRLSQRMGYDGYPELKAEFRPSPDGTDMFEYRGLRPDDGPTAVMRKILDASAQAISDTASVIDAAAYEGTLKALCRARAIMFCGVGNAAVVAQEAYLQWVRVGFPVSYAVDPDLQLVLASQLKPGDVLVAISHTGQTRSLLNVVREAARAGATVVAITNFPLSALAKQCHFVLQTAVYAAYVSGEIVTKRIAELCIIESLFVNFLMRRKGTYAAQLSASNEVLKANKI
ncbi:MAG TPA: MurR/RpiR family transcriptional regulator [Anaeromyxobacter sp.]|nr:MurR/RpiR family transcriptional regulator [Anaeromyxobacter sp.]